MGWKCSTNSSRSSARRRLVSSIRCSKVDCGGLAREELVGVLALVLGPVHGDVGVLEQGRRVVRIVGKHAHADAAGDEQLVAVDRDRAGQRVDQLLRAGRHLLHVAHRAHQHGELVAAQAGDDVALAQARAEALGDLLQQHVAGLVPEGVVDVLEAVEVDEQRRELLAVARGVRQGDRAGAR